MKIKTLLSLVLFVVVVGVGGLCGVVLLLYLCDLKDLVPSAREYVAGAILGSIALLWLFWLLEKLLHYAASKYVEYKTATEVEPTDHGNGD